MIRDDGEGRGDHLPTPTEPGATLYCAFLLRCWADQPRATPHPPRWRFAVVEVTGAGQRYGFASLEAMMLFLQARLTTPAEEGGQP